MPDLIVSSDIDTLLSSASTTVARTNLGLGSTDTVEFGALETSQLNFPNLTTSELNAVTDAVAGDTYFDSDRGQFVRFTGAASYDVITSRTFQSPDESPASSALTLQASRFFESGFLLPTNVFLPTYSVIFFDSTAFSDASGTAYVYSDAAVVPAGWYDVSNVFGGTVTTPVVTPDAQIRFVVNGTNNFFQFHRFIASDVSDNTLATESLQGGSTYQIEVSLNVGDLKQGNVRFDTGYTGLYAEARVLQTCDDLVTGQRIGSTQTELVENDFFSYTTNSKLAVDSPSLGYYTFRFNITPSSDGVFTFSVRQTLSDVDPLMIGEALVVATLMVNK